MKKALLVTRVSGFIPQHEMDRVKILQEMGYEVHYATNLQVVVYGKDNRRLEGTGIITHQIDFQKSPLSRDVGKAYHQLRELMIKESFDLVHCHMPLSAAITRMAAWKVRKQTGREVPVLYTAHGLHFFSGAPLRNWVYYPIERYLSRYTDRLILINQEDYLRGKKFPIRGSVEYVPGIGISLEGYQPVRLREETAAFRRPVIEKLTGRELLPETKVLVTVGELSRNKNHHMLVEMMEELRDLDLVLIIGGTGVQEQSLRAMVREKGLEGRISLPGYLYDVREVLEEADCYILPSHREGLPVAIMEAMAAGLPVIASEIRGVTDLIEHGRGGYLVRGFDPVDYAVKVRRLFTEKYGKSATPRNIRRMEMGQWNQQRIQSFSREVVDQRMREIYHQVAANETRGN